MIMPPQRSPFSVVCLRTVPLMPALRNPALSRIRVFISSPSDVADERAIAMAAVDRLQYAPLLRGRVTFEIVAWDRPAGGVPLLATQTPQASVDAMLGTPSECDIVIVVLWSRLGTPLPESTYRKPDGTPYASGTEWEFDDAVRGHREQGRPAVLLYRRSASIPIDLRDQNIEERHRQWLAVEAFFATLADAHSGALLRGHKQYETPDEFRRQLGRPEGGGGDDDP